MLSRKIYSLRYMRAALSFLTIVCFCVCSQGAAAVSGSANQKTVNLSAASAPFNHELLLVASAGVPAIATAEKNSGHFLNGFKEKCSVRAGSASFIAGNYFYRFCRNLFTRSGFLSLRLHLAYCILLI